MACCVGSRCYHSMLQLAMSSEVTSDSVSREQARALLGEVLHLLASKQQVTVLPC